MAEDKKIATGYIGNALRSTAADHTTAFADEIFDTERQQYQNEVNGIVGSYIENPEFLSVKTDAEGKLLWWIEKDGTVNWSKGVPQPIQVKLQELEQKIKDNADDDKTLAERVSENEAAIVVINEALDNYKVEVAEALSKKMDGEYIENPEFIHVYTDSDGKILWALLNNGKVLYGAGVPDQIMELVNEIYDTFGRYEENPEFIHTHTDSEGKLLWWIERDGTVGWSKGVPIPIQEELKKLEQLIKDNTEGDESVVGRVAALEVAITKKVDGEYIENPEFIHVLTDSEGRVLWGLLSNGKVMYGAGIPDQISVLIEEIYDTFGRYTDNPEFIEAKCDNAGRLIYGVLTDGDFKFGKIPSQITELIKELKEEINYLGEWTDNPEFARVYTDAEGRIIDSLDNSGRRWIHNLHADNIPESFSEIEDIEGRIAINTDKENKVISYRDKEGILHENVGIKTKEVIADKTVSNVLESNSLVLTKEGLSELEQALKDNGFTNNCGDWSYWYSQHSETLELPIPERAILNITNIKDMPKKKTDNLHAYIELFDKRGNYFKVKAIMNAQGASTMADPMKSATIDLCLDEWIGDETFEIKFGHWVAQDSFHLKALWKDSLKSIQPICYTLGEQITKALNARSNRFHTGNSSISLMGGSGVMDNDFDEALCHPDQFPCEVYLNGVYYGLYLWSLKKHRANYSMNKKDYTSILIDNIGGIYPYYRDSIDWGAAEIRNPKKLICVDGEEYDGDTHIGEIIGKDTVAGNTYTFYRLNEATTGMDSYEVTSIDYDSSNKDMVNTAKTKELILKCANCKHEILNATTTEEKRALTEKYFDIDNFIAYIIFSELVYNVDGTVNNAQITIYGDKVSINIYDCDSCLGKSWGGNLWTNSLLNKVSYNGITPIKFVYDYFHDELKQKYATLRNNGVLSDANLEKIVDEWFIRIGHDAISRSISKWNTSPSYISSTNLNKEYWKPIVPSSQEGIDMWNDTARYVEGDKVFLGKTGALFEQGFYECIKDNINQRPVTNDFYPNGFFDNPKRIKLWLRGRLGFLDNLLEYNK